MFDEVKSYFIVPTEEAEFVVNKSTKLIRMWTWRNPEITVLALKGSLYWILILSTTLYSKGTEFEMVLLDPPQLYSNGSYDDAEGTDALEFVEICRNL